MFNILNLATNELVQDGDDILCLDSGRDASAKAKHLTELLGIKHQPRKAGDCADWRAREQAKIDSGEYIVPQCLLEYLKQDHFVHVSKDKPTLLAYTKDEAKGRANIQTRIAVKAYLATFCDIQEGSCYSELLCRRYRDECLPCELLFARTPDDIEAVYTNYDEDCHQVSASCMRGDDWGSGIHPCRVYGAGDLAVAYLVNTDGKTTDRALVWPDKKVYSRVYGESAKLHDLLKKEGYCKSAYYEDGTGSFEGARLLKLSGDPHGNDDDCWVMPYVDENLNAEMEGNHFILSKSGSYSTEETNGRTREPQDARPYSCDRCDERLSYGDDLREVHTSNVRLYAPESWCDDCRDNNTFHCEGYNYYFSDDCDSVEMHDGETWSALYFREHGGTCAKTGDNYPNCDLTRVIVSETSEHLTELWCDDYRDRNAWECERSSRWYSNKIHSIEVVLRNGITQIWSQQAVNEHGDELQTPEVAIPAVLTIADRARLLTLAKNPDER